jgi:hypothetical protein
LTCQFITNIAGILDYPRAMTTGYVARSCSMNFPRIQIAQCGQSASVPAILICTDMVGTARKAPLPTLRTLTGGHEARSVAWSPGCRPCELRGPITPGARGFKTFIATLCSNRKSSTYGSLLSQGRRKRVQTFKQPQNTASRSRRGFRASFAGECPALSDQRRRECRALDAPAASRAKWESKHTSIVTTVTPESPGIPYAMVLRLISCSPR